MPGHSLYINNHLQIYRKGCTNVFDGHDKIPVVNTYINRQLIKMDLHDTPDDPKAGFSASTLTQAALDFLVFARSYAQSGSYLPIVTLGRYAAFAFFPKDIPLKWKYKSCIYMYICIQLHII